MMQNGTNLPEGWAAQEEQRTVVTLYRDGQPIRDSDGRIKEFSSVEEACHVATHWNEYKAPTFAELRGMSDEELMAKVAAAPFVLVPIQEVE